jgi:hypothetical protein
VSDNKDPYTIPLFSEEGAVNREKLPWDGPGDGGAGAETGTTATEPPEPTRFDPDEFDPDMVSISPDGIQRGDDTTHEIKSRIHKLLLERLNLTNLDQYDQDQVVAEIRKVVQGLLDQESAPLNYDEREALVEQVLHEIFGLGPLEPLLQDPTVSDILVNKRMSGSKTIGTCCRSSTASCPRWDVESTIRARWWTRGWLTGHVSTR